MIPCGRRTRRQCARDRAELPHVQSRGWHAGGARPCACVGAGDSRGPDRATDRGPIDSGGQGGACRWRCRRSCCTSATSPITCLRCGGQGSGREGVRMGRLRATRVEGCLGPRWCRACEPPEGGSPNRWAPACPPHPPPRLSIPDTPRRPGVGCSWTR